MTVIRKFRITVSDGKSYHSNHYNLKAIIAVGNKDDSPRTVDFEKGRMELQKSLQLRAIL